ncbi:glycosyltransferase [Vibrio gazogenes]|uniref:dTDP-Rha--alpha-D-GlcNAc-pyrophosphate polyprenol alpha-3-L-rhamnosyltransferase n=1 Tax=Vibrio gazogenes TaxID=687 RepID=A0A1Z2SFL3_VIBGA|nr:glycosyltransferase family 2 protein [Vibrio gazogenes]ASA55951.1 dTDP-Rha--alpha-D-GlcNAc-pyrophosphate polyprenol alpha-3-L-rhamnosyltransferase [Vibrio gazogenes]
MSLFISVVSHNHDTLIANNETLRKLATEYKVIIKSNTQATEILKTYCKESNIYLLQGAERKGFGENNNEIFHYAETHLGMTHNDFFLVLNPDVTVNLDTINKLLIEAKKNNFEISTINLYRDKEMTEFDNSIRRFPSLLNPIKTILGIKRTDYYDKNKIKNTTIIDWAAGSFLMFKTDIYKELNGFNESYFMYFEDVDICLRAKKKGYHVHYHPEFYAIHDAAFANRKLFSINSVYYFKSFIYYFIQKYFSK